MELQISKTNAHHRTIVLFQYLVPVTLVTILSLHSGYLIWTKTIPGEKDHCRDKMVAKSKKMVGVCLFFVFYCFIWLVFIYFYIHVVFCNVRSCCIDISLLVNEELLLDSKMSILF